MSGRVKGFRFAGVHGGIKVDDALDMGLIVADQPATASGVFTNNRVRAAPVVISERRLRTGFCQAVLVNSGNANACTGKQGKRAAMALSRATASALRVPQKLVVPASTGVIGVQLPEKRMKAAIPALVDDLSEAGATRFARAIMTTDRGPKVAQAEVKVGRTTCRVLGVAKGAGMIHPNMATTLAFVTTDASIHRATLDRLLRRAAEETLNRATVDGDTSTNDSLYVLASGAATAAGRKERRRSTLCCRAERGPGVTRQEDRRRRGRRGAPGAYRGPGRPNRCRCRSSRTHDRRVPAREDRAPWLRPQLGSDPRCGGPVRGTFQS